MPKIKTRRSAAKRVKVTAKGKIKHWSPNKSHLLTKKNRRRKRRLKKAKYLEGAQAANYKQLVIYM
ncbi:large subunit ribosomal protein L35 [Thermovibrio guaymasensis]|uniref:Large ribosomal subunit protein bL35 n=1 Tax=Thermovibrio guaymasensis TaxID=240167 RepID=A0A420W9Q8_9BACT|nr:50S ribosomal protein L35 [Thermovibrio guaymasensis]RKQ64049.1 large subunit ribosomal protein L35 [Thermovibrio guaymasensis]